MRKRKREKRESLLFKSFFIAFPHFVSIKLVTDFIHSAIWFSPSLIYRGFPRTKTFVFFTEFYFAFNVYFLIINDHHYQFVTHRF